MQVAAPPRSGMLARVLFRTLFGLAVCGSLPAPAHAQDAPEVRLNQIGFYPAQPKVAVVAGAAAAHFHVVTEDGRDTVLTGSLGPAQTWTPSGEAVRRADFSALRRAGRYRLHLPGGLRSPAFEVRPQVHREVARAAARAFYFMRSGTELPARFAGPWSRPAGHPDTAVVVHPSAAGPGRPAGTVLSAPKGWYDAGDYNKYIVNAGISTYTLLALYEHFPDFVRGLDLDLPESGDRVPDLLDEVLWNLRWMLAMQDPADGGVYHKLTTARFEGAVMPHEAKATRYVVQKSTAAALDFAAVAAQAARVFDAHGAALPGLSDSLRAAAQAAWGWARRHPEVRYDQEQLNRDHDPDVVTGAYGGADLSDEFDWAAMELYLTTGQDSFLTATGPFEPGGIPSWGSVRTLGLYSMLHHRDRVSPAVDLARVERLLLDTVEPLVREHRRSAYGVAMGGGARDFVWGSNAVAANQGMALVQAFRLTRDSTYLHAALANLDYLLGRNATGYAFVTGYGTRTPRHPHHRPSEADAVEEPVPGLLAGGPNPGRQDECPGYPSDRPARAYVDSWCSYASNEIAINWNAPFAYLAGALEALLSPGRP